MKKLILAFFLTTIVLQFSHAQISNRKAQTLFIYNFAKNIKWPQEGASFSIGVLGDKDFLEELNTSLKGKLINNKPFDIKLVSSLSEASSFNMIYIPSGKSKELTSAIAALESKQVLIITENDLADKGAEISFLIVDDKLRFKINQDAISKKGLQVSGGLVTLAMK